MDGRYLQLLSAAAVVLIPVAAQSFSYTPISDASLHDQADAVVVAQVVESSARDDGALPATGYRIHIDRHLKGSAAVADLDVVVAGGRNAYGTLVVSGAPRFQAGERALLFLRDRGDGSVAVAQHALGAFHVRADSSGREVLVRDLQDARVVAAAVPLAVAAGREAPRDLQRFAAWLNDRTRGTLRPADYWLPQDTPIIDGAKYELPKPTVVRWAEFDESRPVDWYATSTGLQGIVGNGYDEFQQGLSAWNADVGSTVQFVYRGTTTASGGLSHPDGINAVQFNDPDDVVAGSFNCLSGGVLATTGTWVKDARTWAHGRFLPLAEADIVVQNGAACFLGLLDNANAAELFAHELGHALGLAHSCGEGTAPDCVPGSDVDDAVMRPILHADGRGAALGADDRRGIGYLYPAPTPQGAPEGAPPPSGNDSGGGSGGGSMAPTAVAGLLLVVGARGRRRQGC